MYNKSILIGRMVADPELRTTPNGVSVCSFRIAVNRPYSKDGGKADFIDIVAWRERAEFVCRYFSKGKPILVEGSIQTRNYEDKNGSKRTAVEVVADNCRFVESKKDSEQVSRPAQKAADVYAGSAESQDFEEIQDDGDLPF